MLAIMLALGAACAWGSSDYIGGLQTRRSGLWAVIVVSQVVGLAGAGAVILLRGTPPPQLTYLVPALLGGLVGAVAISCFYAALAMGTMSIVAPITAANAVVPVLVGVARGERPSLVQAVGMALAFAGVVMAARESGDEPVEALGGVGAPARTPAQVAAHKADRRSIALALVAALGVGLWSVGTRYTAIHDPYWAMFCGRLAGASAFLGYFFVRRPRLHVAPRAALPIVAVAILDTGANGLFAVATAHGLLSVVSVLSSLYPVATIILAHLLLKERIRPSQQAGVAGALVGVVLIAAG
jgi:drug/metabolite transporter (DMT)-like permease